MNIEGSINLLEWANLNKLYIETYNECDYHNIYKAIETLLTAYEKEKGERERIGKLYYEANENCIKYEKMIKKEKEKNKKAIDFINDKNNYFEDGENWQNVLKIKHILEEYKC